MLVVELCTIELYLEGFFCVKSVWLITVNSAISFGFIKHIW